MVLGNIIGLSDLCSLFMASATYKWNVELGHVGFVRFYTHDFMDSMSVPTAGRQLGLCLDRFAMQAPAVYFGDLFVAPLAINIFNTAGMGEIFTGVLGVAGDTGELRVQRLFEYLSIDKQRYFLPVAFGGETGFGVAPQAFLSRLRCLNRPSRLCAGGP